MSTFWYTPPSTGLHNLATDNMARTCLQDASFGPASTCRNLDFTLHFQQTYVHGMTYVSVFPNETSAVS